jgi:kinesin family protein 1
MNATSSRSHTIIVITFAQVNKLDNTEKRSFVNLVDLAGSERQGDTKSEGKTLKEGAQINGSLTALGQVISTLVQKQTDPVKNKSMVVPYRNSTLTKLLANSLGGNSKTIMIGAISPAHDAYEDTLSTLRFLDRAKGIKNVAVVNENPVDKLIRYQT